MSVAYYTALKAADAALNPPIADPAQAAAALAGKTATLTNQKFAWKDAKRVARESATGDWSRIVARSRQTPTLPPATGTDAAILAAINAVESADTDVIDPADGGSWTTFQAGITVLQASGDLSSATVTALNALASATSRLLDRDPTAEDVVAARTQF